MISFVNDYNSVIKHFEAFQCYWIYTVINSSVHICSKNNVKNAYCADCKQVIYDLFKPNEDEDVMEVLKNKKNKEKNLDGPEDFDFTDEEKKKFLVKIRQKKSNWVDNREKIGKIMHLLNESYSSGDFKLYCALGINEFKKLATLIGKIDENDLEYFKNKLASKLTRMFKNTSIPALQ